MFWKENILVYFFGLFYFVVAPEKKPTGVYSPLRFLEINFIKVIDL